MTKYELLYILPAKLEQDEKEAVINRVSQMIASSNGIIQDHNIWLNRKLSYPIKHFRQGIFMLAHVSLPADGYKKIKKELELDEHILRHLLVKTTSKVPAAGKSSRVEKILPQAVSMPQKAIIPGTGASQKTQPMLRPKVQSKKPEPIKSTEKVSLEELDKKLEELLGDETNIK